jgi:hypothetical protein
VLNIRIIQKFVWDDLNQICKNYEINQKSEKNRKWKRIKKRRKAEGSHSGPAANRAHDPPGLLTEAVCRPRPLATDDPAPPVRFILLLWAESWMSPTPPWPSIAPRDRNPSLFSKSTSPLNTPRTPPSSPFAFPRIRCKAVAKSLDGIRRPCRHLRPIPARYWYSATSLRPLSPPILWRTPWNLSWILTRRESSNSSRDRSSPMRLHLQPILSFSLLEAIGNGDHTIEITASLWTSSSPSWPQKPIGATPVSTTWHQPLRQRDRNPSWGEHLLFFLFSTVDRDPRVPDRWLKWRGTG